MSESESKRLECINPECRAVLRIAGKAPGAKLRCPRCKTVLTVPDDGTPEAEATVPQATASAQPAAFRREQAWIDAITGPRRRWRTAMRWTLAASAALHLAFTPLARNAGTMHVDTARYESEYQRKITAAKQARIIAPTLKNKILMPPPPPDPHAVVERNLQDSVTSDVTKVIGGVAEVDLSDRIAARVNAVLADEIKKAAEQIVNAELSAEEIAALQKKYRERAYQVAREELQVHREETQVERARMTTVDWYVQAVQPTLMNNMRWALWDQKGGHLWKSSYSGQYYGWSRTLNWGDLRSNGYLERKLKQMQAFLKAEGGAKDQSLAARSARLAELLREVYEPKVNANGTYPRSSWRSDIYGEIDAKEFTGVTVSARLSEGVIREFHPHRAEKAREAAKQLDALWEEVLKDAQALAEAAESNGAGEELQKTHARCLANLKRIADLAGHELLAAKEPAGLINAALRSQVLRSPLREELFKHWVERLAAGLAPMIRRFFTSQFEKGIIVQKAGVEAALEEFTRDVEPLLKQDLQQLIRKPDFDKHVFECAYPYFNYKSDVTGEDYVVPTEADIRRNDQALQQAQARNDDGKAYAEARRKLLEENFRESIENVASALLKKVLAEGLLYKDAGAIYEGADFEDPVKLKLAARDRALKGRGQDLAKLTEDGVPDTSAAQYALLYGGSKGHGASLEPVVAKAGPAYINPSLPAEALRWSKLAAPGAPKEWGFVEQHAVAPKFQTPSPRAEAIPFLTRFPKLDGDLRDWGAIRPLILQDDKSGAPPIAVYAAWNYQGLFFGYQVRMPAERMYAANYTARRGGSPFSGDHFRLFLDTLDARDTTRGEAHTQEFVVFPFGTAGEELLPGVERLIASKRDAGKKDWRNVADTFKPFREQPSPEHGPDGSGPYRMSQLHDQGPAAEQGYTCEVFLPRNLLNKGVRVMAPGWWIGFECVVALEQQKMGRGPKQFWASRQNSSSDNPTQWGDLLLLGTDSFLAIQTADETGGYANGIVPGHSYLLTVMDPDRNVNISQKDTVVVSVEAGGGSGDVEIFILQETEENSGVFNGYIDTQPGRGREVQGVIEVLAGQEVRFGYLDFANAKGERDVVSEIRLPVVSGMLSLRKATQAE